MLTSKSDDPPLKRGHPTDQRFVLLRSGVPSQVPRGRFGSSANVRRRCMSLCCDTDRAQAPWSSLSRGEKPSQGLAPHSKKPSQKRRPHHDHRSPMKNKMATTTLETQLSSEFTTLKEAVRRRSQNQVTCFSVLHEIEALKQHTYFSTSPTYINPQVMIAASYPGWTRLAYSKLDTRCLAAVQVESPPPKRTEQQGRYSTGSSCVPFKHHPSKGNSSNG